MSANTSDPSSVSNGILTRTGRSRFNERKDPGLMYGQDAKLDPEAYTHITHGGDIGHIKRFMAGNSKGYGLEYGRHTTGIQVNTSQAPSNTMIERAKDYASSRAQNSQGVLTGRIKNKYLYSANNAAEGGLPWRNARHIENVVVT